MYAVLSIEFLRNTPVWGVPTDFFVAFFVSNIWENQKGPTPTFLEFCLSYFNGLKSNWEAYICEKELNDFSQNLDLSEHQVCMNNQMCK